MDLTLSTYETMGNSAAQGDTDAGEFVLYDGLNPHSGSIESSTPAGMINHSYSTLGETVTLEPDDLVQKTPSYLGDEFNICIALGTFVLCAGAVLLNLSIMSFYRPKIKTLIPFLYFILSSSDLVTGICAGIHSIIFIILLATKHSEYDSITVFWLIILSYFLTVVTFKASAFVSMVFAVIRTINIASPFTRIRRKPPIVCIFAWILVWVSVSLVELGIFARTMLNTPKTDDGDEEMVTDKRILESLLIGYFYQPNKMKLIRYMIKNDGNNETYSSKGGEIIGSSADADGSEYDGAPTEECLYNILYTASPVFLCAMITLIATAIQVVFLLKENEITRSGGDPDGERRTKKKISITIIQIGVLFMICSAFTLFQPIIHCVPELYQGLILFNHYQFVYATSYIPFFLNAALNPLILVLRVSQLRAYIWGILTRARGIVSQNPNQGSAAPEEVDGRPSRFETLVSRASSNSLLGRLIRSLSGGNVTTAT